MSKKTSKYDDYSKEELIAKIEKLEKKVKYGLVWEDKQEDVAKQCDNELPVLEEDKDKEIASNPDLPYNIIIEGDNYHSLYTLNFTHKNKIDVIYIDPPYNTGKRNEWKYNDHWVDENDTYRHSKWLSFMEKRLKLAKNLLKETGVIFISIDDNEQAQLKMLCDSVFGSSNFVGQWHWFKSATPPNLSYKIKKNIEYVLGYEKCKNNIKYQGLKKYSKSDDPFTKPQNSIKRLIFPPNSINFKKEKTVYMAGVYGTEKYPNILLNNLIVENYFNKSEAIFENRFIWTQDKLIEEINNRTIIKASESLVLNYKKANYSPEVPPSLINGGVGVITTEEAGRELNTIFNDNVFEYPKPVSLIMYLLSFKDNSVILDFFAGSGTTGHAVLELNKEDGGNRQFILCTNNENNICEEVTYPRIKKVIEGYSDKAGIPANVKYFKQCFVPNVLCDQDKRVLVDRSTELLCIKENTFEIVKSRKEDNDFAIYRSSTKNTVIIFDEDSITECVEWLNINIIANADLESVETIIFVFSYNHTYNEDDFTDLSIPFQVRPIPEQILNVYRKLGKMRKK